jgi:hypothetical protein
MQTLTPQELQIVKELHPIISEHGCLPKESMLITMGKAKLAKDIKGNGGFKKFSQLLDTPLMRFYQSVDGHCLSSSYECIFDNILAKHEIEHEIQIKICNERQYRCDFYIGETYIEVVGYTSKENPDYFISLNKKLSLYKKLKKKVILIQKHVFSKRKSEIEKSVLAKLGKLVLCKQKQRKDYRIENIMDYKPFAFWHPLINIEKFLIPLIDKYGRMPTDKEFRKERAGGLVSAIYKFHDSPYELGKKLGVTVLNKPKGYYSWGNSVDAYKQLCSKYHKNLTTKELNNLGYHGIVKVAQKKGGMSKFREICNLNYAPIRKPYGLYTLVKIVRQYKRECKKQKKFLIKKELNNLGLSDLASAIDRNGGFYKIRELTSLNYEHYIVPPGTYVLNEIVEQYKKACEQKGYFLTKRESLTIFSRKTILFIEREVGFLQLRNLTGLSLEINKKPRIYLYTEEKATKEYKKLCKTAGHFLQDKELKSMKLNKLAWFIRIKIGFGVIRKTTGLKFPSPKKVRRDEITREYKELCLAKKRFLKSGELIKLGLDELAGKIERMIGFGRIRKACKLNFQIPPSRRSLAEVVRIYKKLCREKGYFLNEESLRSLKHANLINAIRYRGGYNFIRKETRLKLPEQKPLRKKSNVIFKDVVERFKKLSLNNRSFFSKNDFLAIGDKETAWYIQNNGGYRRFQRLSGLNIKQMHKPNQKDS